MKLDIWAHFTPVFTTELNKKSKPIYAKPRNYGVAGTWQSGLKSSHKLREGET